MSPVEQLIRDDRWAVAEATTDSEPAIIRHRTPVLGPTGVEGYERFLAITWGYADEGSGELPDAATGSEMQRFEDHLCEAFEQDALAGEVRERPGMWVGGKSTYGLRFHWYD
jgi:hypothetical protein